MAYRSVNHTATYHKTADSKAGSGQVGGQVSMPVSYQILNAMAVCDTIISVLFIGGQIIRFVQGKASFINLFIGLGLLCSAMVIFAMLGIWREIARNATYSQKIAEKLCSH
jgi:hypothetical protein